MRFTGISLWGWRWHLILVVMLFLPFLAQAKTENRTQAIHNTIEKTNIERASHGLAPLKMEILLNQAAEHHAHDMATFGYFAHATPQAAPGIEDFEEYARKEGYSGRTGENLYHGAPIVSQIVELWMTSPDHRSNILEPKYNQIGIGFARGRDYNDSFCVQFFGINPETYPVIINNEAYSTDKAAVHLYLYGQGKMKQMRFSSDGILFNPWEPFQSQREWMLTSEEGLKTVWVEVSDGEKVFRSSDTIKFIPNGISVLPSGNDSDSAP